MILQSLYQLYQRLPDIDRPGFAPMGLSWALVLNRSGELESLLPLRQKAERGSRLVPTRVSAPSPGKRTSGDKAGFLADKTDYVLGFDPAAAGNPGATERLEKRFKLFRDNHLEARSKISHPDFDLVCRFLETWNPEDPSNAERLSKAAAAPIEEIVGSNLAFQISGNTGFVHLLPTIGEYWSKTVGSEREEHLAPCLITGQSGPVKIVHPAIKGVRDEPGKPVEKGIVAFQAQKTAFSSYGKDGMQGVNSPVSVLAAMGYSTALNWLLASKERNFRIGDATAVFWTEQSAPAETLFPWMLSGVPDAEDETTKKRVRSVLEKIARGALAKDELGDISIRYYVLGLSPNASRLSVRFWHTGTLGELITNLKKYCDDLRLARQWDETNSKHPDPLAPTVKDLLLQTAPLKDGRRDESKVPPLLAGALMRSILLGTRYPDALVRGVMNRIRIIERKPKGDGSLDNVTYLRAAILKAWLVRNHHNWLKQQQIVMTTALDKNNPSVAYQLGRLFAVYEQAQRVAHEYKLDRTIRETMFSSASATPLAVFGRLDRLNKSHLQKLKQGTNRFFSDLMDEIHQKVRAPGFYPASLDLKGQSLFCIGYYHQRHDLRHRNDTTKQNT